MFPLCGNRFEVFIEYCCGIHTAAWDVGAELFCITKWHQRQMESSKYVLKDCSWLSTSTCISWGHVQRQLAWLKEIEESDWNDSGETIYF